MISHLNGYIIDAMMQSYNLAIFYITCRPMLGEGYMIYRPNKIISTFSGLIYTNIE